MEAPDVTAPAKAASKAVGHKLGGRKPIVYAIMAIGIIGIAYYLRTRSTPTGDVPTAEDTGTPVTDISGDYPGTTQGVATSDPGGYGGYPSPDSITPSWVPDLLGSIVDAIGNGNAGDDGGTMSPLEPFPSPTPNPIQLAPTVPDSGGGAPGVNTPGSNGPTSEPGTHATPPPNSSPTHAPNPKYPFHSSRGWYRLVTPPDGSRWHYYGPNDSPKVRVSPPTAGTVWQPTAGSPGIGAALAPVPVSGPVTPVSTVPVALPPPPASPAPTPAAVSPYGSRYPYHSDRGWYRLVLPPGGGRYHYYGPNDSPKVRVA